IENTLLYTPPTGTYTATIRGTAVNSGLQGYGLAITGDIANGCSVPPEGDLDGDCHVSLGDLVTFLSSFGACTGDPNFNSFADLNGTGCIDLGDLTRLLANFGM